jgi:peptidoglycan/xylan/chitin deacetylase (PgdA/CDA1 family)
MPRLQPSVRSVGGLTGISQLRSSLAAALVTMLAAVLATPVVAQTCTGPSALGVARIVEIDTAGGPVFGSITRIEKEASFLRRNEVVLTFDDGPMPGVTRPILDVLDRFCVKATFFPVGRMAIAHPDIVKEVAARGHTLGAHTWSHPKLRLVPTEVALEEVERGFTAVAVAAGRPIAPFFRFPGLGDTEAVVAHLRSRGIATFTVDVVSNDSFIPDAQHLARTAIEGIEARHGGIVLFHDIKPQTVAALPIVLAALKERGYRVVHLRAKQSYQPPVDQIAALRAMLARPHANGGGQSATVEGLGDDVGAAGGDVTLHPKAGPAKATATQPAGPARGTAGPAPPDWPTSVLRGLSSPDMR